jgi:CDP-diacylglycerol pyrophosphatase
MPSKLAILGEANERTRFKGAIVTFLKKNGDSGSVEVRGRATPAWDRRTKGRWREEMRLGEIAAYSWTSRVAIVTLVTLMAQPARADRNLLWNVVNLKCLRHLAKSEAPIPCDSIDVSKGWDNGAALLKDSRGPARMLAIPTHPVSGIEDPRLLSPDEFNYFAAAWTARVNAQFHLKHALPRETVAITVDSMVARDQDQLHLQIDCLDRDVAVSLASYPDKLDSRWRPMTIELKGRRYWARRLDSDDLSEASPFRLLADGIDGARAEMGQWSLAAVGADFSGKPGFILLADRADPTAGGRAEDLQDQACAIATARP